MVSALDYRKTCKTLIIVLCGMGPNKGYVHGTLRIQRTDTQHVLEESDTWIKCLFYSSSFLRKCLGKFIDLSFLN